jgi:hypothetical protein
MLLSTAGLDKRQKSNVELAAELGLWGLSGALVHSFAQGIQQKPVFRSNYWVNEVHIYMVFGDCCLLV